MKISLETIIPTHNKIRNYKSVQYFRSIFELGQIDNRQIWPVNLTRTEDSKLYLWNGCHRVVAYYLAGFREISEEYISILDMKYSDIYSVNFTKGFVTPFDPRKECRKAEFFIYKEVVMNILENTGYYCAMDYIVRNHGEYCEKRKINSIKELVEQYVI